MGDRCFTISGKEYDIEDSGCEKGGQWSNHGNYWFLVHHCHNCVCFVHIFTGKEKVFQHSNLLKDLRESCRVVKILASFLARNGSSSLWSSARMG